MNNNTKIEIDSTETDEACPLTKFNSTYVLTETDKEQIIASLETLNAGFTKEIIDINTMIISHVSDSGYYLNVKFDTIPKTSGTYASIAKVNNKFKVLHVGSGDTNDGVKRMEYTLIRICR